MKGIKDKIRQKWYLRWLLFFSNWIAQGIIHADKTEKIYKVLFTLILWFLIVVWFRNDEIDFIILFVISFVIAHTINWFVNGSLATILIHRLFIGELSSEKAFGYLKNLQLRLKANNSIVVVAVFGSITRGELKSSSDIDITFVRNAGFKNAIKSIVFITKEKVFTNMHKIPIEPFLADSIPYMKKRYRADEIPVIIKGETKLLKKFYTKTSTLSEAAKKNNFEKFDFE